MKRSICVFCGSRNGERDSYREMAYTLGAAMANRSIRLVYGGGSVGLMGAVAEGALDAGGEVIGIIPESLFNAEIAHQNLTSLEVVPDMHARKARMASLADAFVALPGGIGTLEELFEVWTWAQLGYHDKPVALLNVDNFYDPLLAFLTHTLEQGFIHDRCRGLLNVEDNITALLDALDQSIAASGQHWNPENI